MGGALPGDLLSSTHKVAICPETAARWPEAAVPPSEGPGKALAGAECASDSPRNQPFRELEACILNMITVVPFVFFVIIAFLFSEY